MQGFVRKMCQKGEHFSENWPPKRAFLVSERPPSPKTAGFYTSASCANSRAGRSDYPAIARGHTPNNLLRFGSPSANSDADQTPLTRHNATSVRPLPARISNAGKNYKITSSYPFSPKYTILHFVSVLELLARLCRSSEPCEERTLELLERLCRSFEALPR